MLCTLGLVTACDGEDNSKKPEGSGAGTGMGAGGTSAGGMGGSAGNNSGGTGGAQAGAGGLAGASGASTGGTGGSAGSAGSAGGATGGTGGSATGGSGGTGGSTGGTGGSTGGTGGGGGGPSCTWPGLPAGGVTLPGNSPEGVAFSKDCALLVVESDTVYRLDPATPSVATAFATQTGVTDLQDVEVSSDGTLYVTSRGANSVVRFDGTTGAFIDTFATTTFNGPNSMAFDASGNLYVSSR
ncbi:MAG: hypothetical protein AB7K71_36245, partial [Polyangiaceae bacterium]